MEEEIIDDIPYWWTSLEWCKSNKTRKVEQFIERQIKMQNRGK